MSTELAIVALTVLGLVVYVIVIVLLPDHDEYDFGGIEQQPPDKWTWASWVMTLAVVWYAGLFVFAFLTRDDSTLFLLFVFPVVFLFFAIRTGVLALRFKRNHPDLQRKEPDDIEEARKRLGLD